MATLEETTQELNAALKIRSKEVNRMEDQIAEIITRQGQITAEKNKEIEEIQKANKPTTEKRLELEGFKVLTDYILSVDKTPGLDKMEGWEEKRLRLMQVLRTKKDSSKSTEKVDRLRQKLKLRSQENMRMDED
ncbi:hypothetical protein R1sor_001228 [Riccia sorocarpa]|uniref:Uncharacterized protein n=1 Tax=Riccia sorocarpa TaxID=122646 RepID=A0ABD3GXC7_9MARC